MALTLCLLISASAFAVSPQSWKVDTTDEFLAGEVDGFAVSTRGEIMPGPRIEKLAEVADPFVLSQAYDGKGTYFIGTGNSGNLYRFRSGKLELIHQVSEPEIYAMAFVDGTLVVGSSPNGKLYAVDPASGASRELFDPGEAYIWSIATLPDGSLLVGTGLEGRIYKVGLDGTGSVLFDSPDTHIRSIDVMGSRILAGSAGSTGKIYEISGDGTGRALHESSFSEISAVAFDQATGTAWAAAVTTVLPTTAPTRAQGKPSGQAGQGGTQQSDGAQDETAGSASVDVSFSFGGGPAPSQAARIGSSEVLRIERDGFVTSARRFEREIVYALRAAGDDSVDVAVGPSGRLYRLSSRDVALLASVPEKQIVTLAGSEQVLVTTTNAGAIYSLSGKPAESPELRSKAGDASRFSTFGSYVIEGRGLSGADIRVWFRSGNTSTPDDTWSSWSDPVKGTEGTIAAPPARYLQWKLQTGKGSDDLRIDSVTCSFVNRNIAPQIENVTLHDPGVVFISSAYPSAPQVLEATNPDEYGIFNSLDNPSSRNDPGKKLFRKSYRTVTWRATDENGDDLRYTLEFRPEGTGAWLRLRENMSDTNFNFDTSQLPDGRYEIRLTATDERSNPGEGLATVDDGVVLMVDNTSPTISSRAAGEHIEVLVRDGASAVVKAEYSVDAKEWIQIVPVAGFADSREETYRIPRKDVEGRLVVFRAVDAQYNVAAARVTAPR
jgi:outer membrane protein assembly factor BamB